MATTFSTKGSSNSLGNNLHNQIDVPGGEASDDSYAGVAEALDKANNLINKKQIEKDTILETFRGYLPDKYQKKNIKNTNYIYIYADKNICLHKNI